MGTTKKTKFDYKNKREKIMVKRIPLTSSEKIILETLYKKDMPMTPNAIAKESGLAYVTVRKYIAKLIIDTVLIESWIKKPQKEYKMKAVEQFKKKLVEDAEKRKRSESKRYIVNPEVFNKS